MIYPKYDRNYNEWEEKQSKLLDFLNRIGGATFCEILKNLNLKDLTCSSATLTKHLLYSTKNGLITSKSKRYIITNEGIIFLNKLREQKTIRSITSTHAFMIGINNKDHTAPSTTAYWGMHSQQKLEPNEEKEIKKIINECGQKIYDILPKEKIKKGAIVYHFK